MNYYPHHIGDYLRDTAHLSMIEDAAYLRMLHLYYASERPLPLNLDGLYRLLRAKSKDERHAVDMVLQEFFERRETGWHNARADAEIAKWHGKSHSARTAADKRWQSKRNADASPPHSESDANQNHNQNQKTDTSAKASVSGGKPPRKPADPVKEEIWRTGRQILEGQGESKDAAGSFLGKLCQDYGNVLVREAVRDCARVIPASAKEWLVARCQERRGTGKQSQLERRNAAVASEWAGGADATQ